MDDKFLEENAEAQPAEQELSLVEASIQMEPLEEEAAPSYALVRLRRRKPRIITDKERYSKILIAKAKKAVKIIKGLVIAAGALAGILLIYGILSLTVIEDKQGALIGFFVMLSFIMAIFIALIVMFVYAKIQLDRLKRLR